MHSFLQVLFAVCLVVVFFVIGFAIYNYEFLKSLKSTSGVLQETVPIFTGIKDLQNTDQEVYDTMDSSKPSYRNIGPSYNQKGGVEFSYSFWLFLDDDFYTCTNTPSSQNPDEGIKETNIERQNILFLKGVNERTTYKNLCNTNKTDYMVKCPLVKLEECGSQLTIEFNTVQNTDKEEGYVEGIKQNARNVCTESTTVWKQANAHKLTLGNINRSEFNKKWILVTLVLQDTFPTDPLPYRNKVRCRVYINNLIELDTYVDGSLIPSKDNVSTLKTNKGPFYLFPRPSVAVPAAAGGSATTKYTPKPANTKKLMMGDLTYYNYAVDQTMVDKLFASGPPTKASASLGSATDYSDVLAAAQPSKVRMTN